MGKGATTTTGSERWGHQGSSLPSGQDEDRLSDFGIDLFLAPSLSGYLEYLPSLPTFRRYLLRQLLSTLNKCNYSTFTSYLSQPYPELAAPQPAFVAGRRLNQLDFSGSALLGCAHRVLRHANFKFGRFDPADDY